MPTSKAKPERPVAKGIDRFGRSSATAEPKIDREGGKFGAGIIRGVSLATVGEALGHDYWIDSETISQIEALAKATGDTGLKSRFTHPSMSSDGMGRHLGRLFDVRTVGNQSIGDLHFSESAHSTPDGDLAEYVMQLTEEDPQAAGLSIVFHHDFEAEQEFQDGNLVDIEYQNYRGDTVKGKRFKSPDESNVNNYPHVRISELRASDVVDEPAANPNGMFDAESLPREIDALLSYAAGLSDVKPNSTSLGVDSDRASQFLGRWLHSHGLSITKKDATMAEDLKKEVEVKHPQPTREDFAAELNKFTSKFGAENGAKWFGENKSYGEALELHCEALSTQLASEKEATKQAEERLASMNTGEQSAVDTGAPAKGEKQAGTGWNSLFKQKAS